VKKILRLFLFLVLIRPIILILIGLKITHRSRLPKAGPAIIVANHNSHLDTLVLMTLFPLSLLHQLRPVAAAEYFLRNRWLAWFAMHMMQIVPIDRLKPSREDKLGGCSQVIEQGGILIIYPEGSRGAPESIADFKSGIAHLAKAHPTVPIYPIFLHGLGKSLPKGDFVLVPFCCDVLIGEPLVWNGNKRNFMESLATQMNDLAAQGKFPSWD
jgi:1-acyl-sn-glycerol-3-phosphate acyltransferase